jgi:hypothetical protein
VTRGLIALPLVTLGVLSVTSGSAREFLGAAIEATIGFALGVLVGLRESSVVCSRSPVWIVDHTQAGQDVMGGSDEVERLSRLQAHSFDYVLVDTEPYPDARRTVAVLSFQAFAERPLRQVQVTGALTLYAVP